MKKTNFKKLFIVLAAIFLIGTSAQILYIHNSKTLENIIYSSIESNPRKYCVDTSTYKSITKKKIVSVTIATDNQGSGNLMYYVGKINNYEYQFFLKKRGVFEKPKLMYIKKLQKDTSKT